LEIRMTTARRTFLKQAGLGATALAAGSAQAFAAPIHTHTPTRTDMLEAAAYWDELQIAQQAQTWDTSWTKKITGKYKALFDIPEIEGGVGVYRSGIWQRQYADVLKTQPGDITSVMVIRHNGIFLAMNQEFWTTYEVGKTEKLKGDDGKTMKHNPVLAAPGQEVPASMRAFMLDQQLGNGAIALGCGLAFRSVVALVQKKDKLDANAARAKANAMLVPGVIMQPSGIFADVMAQEAGCVFVNAV
jgi:hypothetical protein